MKQTMLLAVLFSLFIPLQTLASGGGESGGHGTGFAAVLAFLGVIVVGAKIAGAIAERLKQVSVLGELAFGLALGIPLLFGIHAFEDLRNMEIVQFVAELAVILLLFHAGLESSINEMKRVGVKALLVAIIGVTVPFVLGTFVIAPWLFAHETFHFAIFLGATMTATSVGITARVFKDLGISNTKSAKIVLGAAVFDDVIGLIILAVVLGLISGGSVGLGELALITIKALAFLVVSIWIGRMLAPHIGRLLSKIHSGIGMKMALVLAFAFGYAYLGSLAGLAPIVGAFAAGLLLDAVHFKRFASARLTHEVEAIAGKVSDPAIQNELRNKVEVHRHRHIEDLIDDFGLWFIPIFFVMTGMAVHVSVLGDLDVLLAALALTVAAVIGKVVSGFAAGKGADWKLIGFGMVPRGEVGLIFASIGLQNGVLNPESFAALVVMIILTTFVTPIVLPRIVGQKVHTTPAAV